MDDDEQKCPTTKIAPLDAIWFATATACLGSQESSPTMSASFSPRIPPAALMSEIAISAPRFICSPKGEYCPLMGPAIATRMSANAVDASARTQKEKITFAQVNLILILFIGLLRAPCIHAR